MKVRLTENQLELIYHVQDIREYTIKEWDNIVDIPVRYANRTLGRLRRDELPTVLETLAKTAPDLTLLYS